LSSIPIHFLGHWSWLCCCTLPPSFSSPTFFLDFTRAAQRMLIREFEFETIAALDWITLFCILVKNSIRLSRNTVQQQTILLEIITL
jgi:hypothetical protein